MPNVERLADHRKDPRDHRFLKLGGRGTTGDDLRPCSNQGLETGIRSLTPPVSMIQNELKLLLSALFEGRRGLVHPAKAMPTNRLMSGAGDGKRGQMILRQQLRRRLRRRKSMGTSYRGMPCSRRFLKLAL